MHVKLFKRNKVKLYLQLLDQKQRLNIHFFKIEKQYFQACIRIFHIYYNQYYNNCVLFCFAQYLIQIVQFIQQNHIKVCIILKVKKVFRQKNYFVLFKLQCKFSLFSLININYLFRLYIFIQNSGIKFLILHNHKNLTERAIFINNLIFILIIFRFFNIITCKNNKRFIKQINYRINVLFKFYQILNQQYLILHLYHLFHNSQQVHKNLQSKIKQIDYVEQTVYQNKIQHSKYKKQLSGRGSKQQKEKAGYHEQKTKKRALLRLNNKNNKTVDFVNSQQQYIFNFINQFKTIKIYRIKEYLQKISCIYLSIYLIKSGRIKFNKVNVCFMSKNLQQQILIAQFFVSFVQMYSKNKLIFYGFYGSKQVGRQVSYFILYLRYEFQYILIAQLIKLSNSSFTQQPVLEETSKNSIPKEFASYLPSIYETFLYYSKSHLFPIKASTATLFDFFQLQSLNHY
ncbi:transmembrane protein, putative (macronuclear) [Tetrahymena thermophila SB210]|uniref:Transmembrane protein, putative n=1 Tax=Tetrahymena thermophila (strain SB210) TaxID=312017 RepID=W7XFL7_TETTS|nr:transmembrane protein, putative [Tetrahymena thermophila SB210]EWS76657.1 transmembrane protein, putative [Tetrahymena thermophila SB210]|eukprot:XP_012650825.1 transmembrane protein, putative [Tetrahymena thermophila SB210]